MDKLPLSRGDQQRLVEIGDWVRLTCLLFGVSAGDAYHLAGIFVQGLERDWEQAAEKSGRREE